MVVPGVNTVVDISDPKGSQTSSEKARLSADEAKRLKDGVPGSPDIAAVSPVSDADSSQEKGEGSDDAIIITGADAALHLLPLRDDGEPALSFRSIFLATILSAFQAVMNQIYTVRRPVLPISASQCHTC